MKEVNQIRLGNLLQATVAPSCEAAAQGSRYQGFAVDAKCFYLLHLRSM